MQVSDQSGQNLVWSLGTISGYGRTSVTLKMSLPDPLPATIDTGESAYAMLDAAMVSAGTPAAILHRATYRPTRTATACSHHRPAPMIP